MKLLNTLEKRAPWLAFPQLFRLFVMMHGVFFALLLIRPEAADSLAFNYNKILDGEVWRVVSHFLIPPIRPGGALTFLFLFFYIMIGMMLSDGLEGSFSPFRFSLFIYASALSITIAFLAAGRLALPEQNFEMGGYFLYETIFMAFAVLYPMYKINLFGIIPVPMWLLGLLPVIQGFSVILSLPIASVFFLIAFAPLLIWSIPRIVLIAKGNVTAAHHRAAFQRKVAAATPATLHECYTCKRTEKDDDTLEFRVSADGEEYCTEHLPPKQENS